MCLQEPVQLKTPRAVFCACFCVYQGTHYPNQSTESFSVEASQQRCWCPGALAARYSTHVAELNTSIMLRLDPTSLLGPIESLRVV